MKGETDNYALVACTAPGELVVLDCRSTYLSERVLGGLTWEEMGVSIDEELGYPPDRRGIWIATFDVGGGAQHGVDTIFPEYEYWPINIEWRRPPEPEWARIIDPTTDTQEKT